MVDTMATTPTDETYEFGHPWTYLTQPEAARCRARGNMVQYVRLNWHCMPKSLWPIAEDISSETPAWLKKPPQIQVESNFD